MRDINYYRRRAQEERALAECAKDERVRKAHQTLADAYEARAEACAVRRIAIPHPEDQEASRNVVPRGGREDPH